MAASVYPPQACTGPTGKGTRPTASATPVAKAGGTRVSRDRCLPWPRPQQSPDQQGTRSPRLQGASGHWDGTRKGRHGEGGQTEPGARLLRRAAQVILHWKGLLSILPPAPVHVPPHATLPALRLPPARGLACRGGAGLRGQAGDKVWVLLACHQVCGGGCDHSPGDLLPRFENLDLSSFPSSCSAGSLLPPDPRGPWDTRLGPHSHCVPPGPAASQEGGMGSKPRFIPQAPITAAHRQFQLMSISNCVVGDLVTPRPWSPGVLLGVWVCAVALAELHPRQGGTRGTPINLHCCQGEQQGPNGTGGPRLAGGLWGDETLGREEGRGFLGRWEGPGRPSQPQEGTDQRQAGVALACCPTVATEPCHRPSRNQWPPTGN